MVAPPAQPSKRSGGTARARSLIDALSGAPDPRTRRAQVNSEVARSGRAEVGSVDALDVVRSPTRINPPPLLTARTVAEVLGVCTETVLRWIRNGELPAIHLPGGAVRIPQDELTEWLRSRATPRRGVLATKLDAANRGRYPQDYDGGASYHLPPTTGGPADEED